jgi:hypothetical protein
MGASSTAKSCHRLGTPLSAWVPRSANAMPEPPTRDDVSLGALRERGPRPRSTRAHLKTSSGRLGVHAVGPSLVEQREGVACAATVIASDAGAFEERTELGDELGLGAAAAPVVQRQRSLELRPALPTAFGEVPVLEPPASGGKQHQAERSRRRRDLAAERLLGGVLECASRLRRRFFDPRWIGHRWRCRAEGHEQHRSTGSIPPRTT